MACPGANRIQQWLKLFCRIIFYLSAVSMVLLYFYVYYTHSQFNNLKISGNIKRNMAFLTDTKQKAVCLDYTVSSSEGCLPCPRETFSFSGWSECEPWLNCSGIALHVRPTKRILGGHLKGTWLADWRGHQVVYVNCSKVPNRKSHCLRGMTRIEQLQGPFVTRLIGKCFEKAEIVVMYYKHGSAKALDQLLHQPQYSHLNTIQTRLQLSVDYVKIMTFMHNSSAGPIVMCDTSSVPHLLSQYLITDDFHLIVNDMDSTPQVTQEKGILCRRKILKKFFAPEQKMPNISTRAGSLYDEKTDIWKIPAVVKKLLNKVNGSDFVERELGNITERCHVTNPEKRPTASEVLQELLRVQQLIT